MGKKVYIKTALTGGGDTALDGIDGSLLNNNDVGIVTVSGVVYFYVLNHDNSSAENSPWIIPPDKNYGTKRWVWQPGGGINATMVSVYSGTSQTGLVSGVPTKVNLDTEAAPDYDIGGNFASYKFTAPVTGYYSAKWSAYLASDGGTLIGGLAYLFKDGAQIGYGSYAAAINGYLVSSGSKDVYMVAGTYLEVYALGITSSSTWQIVSERKGTFSTVHLISGA